jgi:iron complex outermembrane receptor protein
MGAHFRPGSGQSFRLLKSRALAGVAFAAFTMMSQAAHAQAAASLSGAPQDAQAVDEGGEITVTGSRIVRDGYDAPTPVSVISTQEIKAEAPANISDFVNTLPAVRGSTTSASSNGALSNGQAGINTVNLRNLGANRTLVLIDGQRSVASAPTGQVDVNTIPQALIERVEVVTGGASSAYGSDAVSGVINFILDKKFTGFKTEYEYGVTTYGDGPNHKFSATGGKSFADGRGHILLSGEYFTQKGIQSIDRDWNDSGFFIVNNPQYSASGCTDSSASTICYPEYLVTSGAGASQFTPGGLITGARTATGAASGAALAAVRGLYFGNINPATGTATVNQLAFGQTSGQWMVGGDYDITSAAHRGSATLLPSEKRAAAFARVSYEISPAIEIFGQFTYSRYSGQSYYQLTPTTGVTIQRDNAYLPQSVRDLMVANNLTSIQIGTNNTFLPPQGSDNTREVFRYVVGGSGEFSTGGIDWKWDGYYQLGKTKTNELLTNTWYYSRMDLATDAVFAPAGNAAGIAAGTIVCRSTLTDPSNGCVPLNRIGTGGASSAAVNYVLYDGLQPLRNQELKQEVAAVSFSTNNLIDLWAGPISLAFGAEYRKESIDGSVDPLFQSQIVNGVTVSNWRYGNYLPIIGGYNVKEAFIETIVPLFKGADFNGAFRLTDYSTSGSVKTWKAGITWQAIEDVKLRGTISRDIRAPNLNELFAPGAGATNSVNRPVGDGTVVPDGYINSAVGNPALKPEIAKTYGAGVVLTPRFLPGFAASVDYYKINLSGAIATLSAQTIVDQCYLQGGIYDSCSFISTSGGRGVTTPGLDIVSVDIQPRNFASIKTSGIDFEMSYRREIGPGNFTLRALASRAIELKTDNGATAVTDSAGENSGSLPDWTYRFSAGYSLHSGFSLQAIARGVSGGVYNNNYVTCSTDCPVSTADFRTINTNKIKGAFYFDLNTNYNFTLMNSKAEVFLSIRNIFDKDPVLVANGPSGDNTGAYPQTNRNLYDVLGRVFRMGVRLSL